MAILFTGLFFAALAFTIVGYKKNNRYLMLIGFLLLVSTQAPDAVDGFIDGYTSCMADETCKF